MEWLQPAGAWAFIAIVPVILLYLLHKRVRQKPVPSLLLWRKTQMDEVHSRPLLHFRNQLLMWLQLLMIAVLAISLMHPATGGKAQQESVWIFDLSASMQTLDTHGISRMRRAQEAARKQLDSMPVGEKLTILTASAAVEQPLTRSDDRAEARRQLSTLVAQNGSSDLAGALALAQAMQRELAGVQITVFSDNASLSALPKIGVVGVGESMPNQAILDVTVQPESGTAFAQIRNDGPAVETALECHAEGVLCDLRTVSLEAHAQTSVRFAVPKGTQEVCVRFAQPDALQADDTRYGLAPRQNRHTALLVTDGNVFLQHALALDPLMTVDLAAPSDAQETATYDLYVYDGCLPEKLPQSGAVFAIDPGGEVFGIQPAETVSQAQGVRAAAGETARALCENLLLDEIAIKETRVLNGGTAVLQTNEGAVLSVYETQTHRVAVLGFDLHRSNLPLKADFPVLIQNLLKYLLPDNTASVAQAACGEEVALHADVRAQQVWVRTPSGKMIPVKDGYLRDTNEIGIYALIEQYADGTERETRFTLHIPTAESAVNEEAVSADVQYEAKTAYGLRDWSTYLLMLLFVLVLVEWEVSRRGT